MGKGDIRTRRGKIWRRTYGVSRPRRWKTTARPAATTRKVKTLKDLPKAAAAEPVKKVPEIITPEVVETQASAVEAQHSVSEITPAHESASVEAATAETSEKKAAKKPAVKKAAVKKAPAKKKAE
jgi:ribosomal small subunit protein bTHX